MLKVTESIMNSPDESQFEIWDFPPHLATPDDPATSVKIHPWDRIHGNYQDRSVYITIGTGGALGDDDYQNIIVNRDTFIAGILATFPELTYAGDSE